MLEHLEREDPAAFAKALSESPSKEDRATPISDVIGDIVAAVAGR